MINIRLGASLTLVAALCACSHAPRVAEPPSAFEARWLELPRSPGLLEIPREQVNEFSVGKFLVIETNDVYLPEGMVSFLIDSETILTESEEKKTYLKDFLKAAYPNLLDGPTAFPGTLPVGTPDFSTVDAYVSGLKESRVRREKEWAKEQPGKPFPFPKTDHEQLRADLLKKLEGKDALILRYINAKRKAPRP